MTLQNLILDDHILSLEISSFLRSRALGTCRFNLGMAASNTSTSFSLGKCYRCDRPTKRIFQCHGSPSERRQMTPVPRALQLRRMLRLTCPSPPRRMSFKDLRRSRSHCKQLCSKRPCWWLFSSLVNFAVLATQFTSDVRRNAGGMALITCCLCILTRMTIPMTRN